MYVFNDSTLKYLLEKIKSKIALKSELDNKVDKVNGKGLSDNDFTNAAKQSLENKYTSIEANYSTGMTHIKFSNENESNAKTIDLKTGCDMFFYPTIDTELIIDLNGNVTIPYAFISKSGSDIGKVTVNIKDLTENTNSENVFNVTDNGSELVLENISLGNKKISFTIEGDTEELKANVLGEYSTVIMSLLTIYRSTDASLVPSNVSDTKTVVSDFGNGEYEIMLYTGTGNHLDFSNAQTLINVSYISDNITNMANTYRNCQNLTGAPVCGPNVTNMAYTYYNCPNLYGDMYVYSDKISSAGRCFFNRNASKQLNVLVNFGTKSYDSFKAAYAFGSSLVWTNAASNNSSIYYWNDTANIVIFNMRTTNMANAFKNDNIITKAACGPNVTNMAYTYRNCDKLTGSPVCGPNVTNMYATYEGCINLTGNPVCGPNVIYMDSTYRNCNNITGAPVCGDNVTSMSHTYYNCHNLTGSPVCGNNVASLFNAYSNCYNLTGTPVCENRVTDMRGAYSNCYMLTGSPVCGDSVMLMESAYYNCRNLKGSPVCGDNVADMTYTYCDCHNLTGSPVCGNKVTDMHMTYRDCYNLTGSPVCGNNVTSMYWTYTNCTNLGSNGYFYSSKVDETHCCFRGRNIRKRLNLYVPAGSTTLDTCLRTKTHNSLTETNITWTNYMSINGCHYNTAQNIYIYPVANVALAYKNNELGVVTYTASDLNIRPNIIKSDGSTADLNDLEIEQTTDNIKIYKKNINISISRMEFANNKKLTGISFMTDSITNMSNSFRNCSNLTSSPMCGDNVTTMDSAYYQCSKLTGSPVCGPNVTNMRGTYSSCTSLTGQPMCGYNVTDMAMAYYDCTGLTGYPTCGDKVTDMRSAYYNCKSLTGSPACGPKVTDISNAYDNCYKLTGNPVCGSSVVNMHYTYSNCYMLTGAPVCGDNVTDMGYAYYNCRNIKGRPVCGPNVTTMSSAYYQCYNLTGQPVCGLNVVYMSSAYAKCNNITGRPVCGPNVTTMSSAYVNCNKLTGNPVCGNKVTTMSYAYYGCSKLTGPPVCGLNVTDMYYAYSGCTSLGSNGYFYSDKITDVYCCFEGRNTRKRLNLYVPAGSTTLDTCLRTKTHNSLTGDEISWTNDTTNNRYYNTAQNIYIYPVANVADAYNRNEYD